MGGAEISAMAPRGTLCFVAVLIFGQLCMSLAVDEGVSDAMEMGEMAGAEATSGALPVQEMKQKAEEIERSTLAKHKVKADRKEQQWKIRVQKIKVEKIADASMGEQGKYQKLQEGRIKELTAKNEKKSQAEQDIVGYKTEGARLAENMARNMATQESAAKALRTGIKSTAKLVAGEGKNAIADRKAASAMLAELRVAEAHADGTIKGLTDAQKANTDFQLLHAAVETAVGTPTLSNVDLAEKQLKDTAKKTHEKHGKLIGKMEVQFKAKRVQELKNKEDRAVEDKAKKELKEKRGQEKGGKKVENINDHMELPGKKIKEWYQKKANDLVRNNWFKHEQRVTDELAVKSRMKTERMIANEQSDKKGAKLAEAENKKVCKSLLAKKVSALERRHKAISAFSAARRGLIKAQATLNGQKTTIEEAPSYQNKGNECQTQSKYYVGGRFSTSKAGCEKACSAKGKACHAFNTWEGNCQLLRHGAVGDHLECPTNRVTGERECPNKLNNCNLYQKVTGPGSEESLVEDSLELGDDDSVELTAEDSLNTGVGLWRRRRRGSGFFGGIANSISKGFSHLTGKEKKDKKAARDRAERSNKAKEKSAKVIEKSAKERNDKTKQKNAEKNKKAAVKRANANAKAAEANRKSMAQAKLLADEKRNKRGLKAAERRVQNAGTKMKERNLKAADADTQARKCEGNLARRRRTCACDDAGGEEMRAGRRLLAEAAVETEEEESTGWERRRYVRRRYVAPSSVDRRRRLNFPAPPPPARIPGAVCPCCPKKVAGVARSRACQLADAKEMSEKNQAKARL